MSFAAIKTRAVVGLSAHPVSCEVHLSGGLPGMSIVGLPDTAIKEARDRVRSAIQNSGFEFPARRITVNLSPADIPKDGSHYDLAIALGVLAASQQIQTNKLESIEVIGELGLDGSIRRVIAAVPIMLAAEGNMLCPIENLVEAQALQLNSAAGASHLREVANWLAGLAELGEADSQSVTAPSSNAAATRLEDIKGQANAKRALAVAAAGRHNLLMIGPPGCGKSLLASALPSILPELTIEQAREVASIRSVSGHAVQLEDWRTPPYRSPHHSASSVAIVGGGSQVKPGEISLAHHGVLFLDEFPEFNRQVLEVLREPLEKREIHISRAARQAHYPANFQLIAAMNPAPTGVELDGSTQASSAAQRYRQRISAPLLDRIDQLIQVPKLELKQLVDQSAADETLTSEGVKLLIAETRARQFARQGKLNSELSAQETDTVAVLSAADKSWLTESAEKLGLSARGYHRVLRLARTIADLKQQTDIQRNELLEALNYRRLEKGFYN